MADEYSTKRIINLPAESGPAEGDVFVVDNESTGTKKLPITGLIDPTLSQSGQAADAKKTGDKITSLKEEIGLSDLSFTVVSGKYIDNSGADKTSANFDRSEPILIPAESIVVTTAAGYNQGVAMIATCDASGNNIKAVTISIDSTKRTYTFYTKVETYVMLSYLHTQGCITKLLNRKSNDVIDERLTPVENYVLNEYVPTYNIVSGKFINSAGAEASSNNFSHSTPIQIPANSFITFKATGYLTSVAMIAICDAEGTTFTPVAVSEDSTEHTYYYFAENDCYITVSYKTSNTHDLYVNGATSNKSLLAHIDNVKSYIPLSGKNILPAFTNITCAGDSLTYGAVFTAQNTYRQAYRPYPQIIAGETGVSVNNVSSTGATALSWWNSYNSQIEEKTNQLAIIYLGTNEGLTDTIDTDCAGNDYSQWEDTNTGCYGKIIAKFLENNSRVVLVKCNHSSGDIDITNSVIEKFSEKFSVAVVDNPYLGDRKYHYFPDGSGFNTVHYNDLGYAVFAYQLIYNLGELETDMMKRIIPN